MDLTGRIIAVMPAQSGTSARTGNPWMSQDYVIEVPGQFPRRCVFRVFGEDRIRQFNIQMGDDLTVQFDIDAHEYQGRWFNDIRAFNVVRGQMVPPQAGVPFAGAPQPTPFPPAQPVAPEVAAAQPVAVDPAQSVSAQPQPTPFPPAQEMPVEGSADDLPF